MPRLGAATPARHEGKAVFLAICAVGVSAVMSQLVLMREMLGVFCGNEMVLGVILGNWLLLTGLGAWAGWTAKRIKHAAAVLIVLQVLIAVMPVAQVFALRTLRNLVFLPGTMIGPVPTVLGSLAILAPYCVVSGYTLTLACDLLARRQGQSGIGRVYLADSVGSIIGGLAFTFVLVGVAGHFGMLYVPAVLNLVAAGAVAIRFAKRTLAALAAVVLAGFAAAAAVWDADAASMASLHPSQEMLFSGNSPYGSLVVGRTAGQLNFISNGLPVISTNDVEHVEETVHYVMAQRPSARRVLLVGGGVSGTAREILKYGVREVTYVELDPLIIEAARRFMPECLADPRIKVVNTDGRQFIQRAADGPEKFDVVIVDVPDPSTAQINRFYTAEFLAAVKRVMADRGVLSLPLGHYENYVSPELARMLASAQATLKRSFANVLMLPGARVFMLASDGELTPDIAARIEQKGIATRLVNRHYLDAALSPDRVADLARAAGRGESGAAVNEDFAPVLYYYHLRHWMSQFPMKIGLLAGVMAAAIALYLLRMRPAPMAIFASGFAASAMELALLLAFQAMCGSVYRQVGLIVAAFMAGLAVGAILTTRRGGPDMSSRKWLAALSLAIGAYTAALPLALIAMGRAQQAGASPVVVQAAIAALTFVLAALVGMEFPLAGRIQESNVASTASRLYAADFIGASLGALLAGTVLIPLLGLTALCLIAAGLNALAVLSMLLRRA